MAFCVFAFYVLEKDKRKEDQIKEQNCKQCPQKSCFGAVWWGNRDFVKIVILRKIAKHQLCSEGGKKAFR